MFSEKEEANSTVDVTWQFRDVQNRNFRCGAGAGAGAGAFLVLVPIENDQVKEHLLVF